MFNLTMMELTKDAVEMQNAIEENAENADLYIDSIEANNLMINEKADSYAAVALNIEAEIKEMAEYVKKASDRKMSLTRKLDRLKDRLMYCMLMMGKKNIGDKSDIKVVGNGGKRKVTIVDMELLPDKFKKITIEPDNDKIREALEKGEEVPGCVLEERGQHLSIKFKGV